MRYFTPFAINCILESNRNPPFVKKDGNSIMNEAISFDIEVTSTYLVPEKKEGKIAFMYVWMLDIFDKTIIGRTWEEFVWTMNSISSFYSLNGIKRRILVFVHNLAYEFQFMRKWFHWLKVFSLSRRKPLYALTTSGIEFRCSYRLAGYKLEKVGEQMGIEKLPDFDYRKIRHSKTHLTPREYEYCIHDVKIVCAFIRKKMQEENGNISEIPLTKTGYVRRYVRNYTLKGKNRCFYKNAISSMTLEPEEYLMAKRAFAGGFTHASRLHAAKYNKKKKKFETELNKNVTSFDFSSSYPSVLIAEMYPMSKGVMINPTREEFDMLMEKEECCMFRIEMMDVKQIFPVEAYISESRCVSISNPVVNNGRVVSADRIVIDITTIDYNIIKKVYKFNLTQIGDMYYYQKAYLPTTFIECVLHFYEIKTTLKDVDNKKDEYMNGKENLNSLFGMCVTDIVREVIPYSDKEGWKKPESMTDDEYQEFVSNQLDKENSKKSRFLFYLWGVFCTAYARKNLWQGIFECKSDYIYSDTDSIKITNADKHMKFINKYNEEVTKKLEAALDYHHLPHELIRPKNVKGKEKPMGIWDFDGFYKEFKAIRAKSYMYMDDTGYHMTVAGLAKNNAIAYLNKICDGTNVRPIDKFEYGMEIPAAYLAKEKGKTVIKSGTGKLTHSYIDEPFSAIIYDYNNLPYTVHEKSCVHLDDADFHLSVGRALQDYLRGKETGVYK